MSETKIGVRTVMRNSDFLKLWLGQLISNTGTAVSLIALPLFVFALTNSTLWLGFITIVEVIPIIVISPIAGVFVDTHNRKRVMIGSDIINAMVMLCMPLAVILDTKGLSMAIIIILVFLNSTSTRFFYPARSASIPKLVKEEELMTAVSLSQTMYQIIMVIGPAIGAGLIALAGYVFAFTFNAITFLFSAFFVSLIKTSLKVEHVQTKSQKNSMSSLLVGTKTIARIPTIRYLAAIILLITITNAPTNSFLVAFVEGVMNMTNVQYGIAVMLLGIGGVLSGIIMTSRGNVKHPLILATVALTLIGIITSPVLIITQSWQLYILLFLDGVIGVVINIPANTVLMRDTQDETRGQVFSAISMLMSFSQIIGILYGILMVPMLGLRMLFFINSVVLVVVGILGLFYLLLITNLDTKSMNIQKKSINLAEADSVLSD